MSIQIKTASLLHRWYQEWVNRGGTPPPTMNLCHFVRVLLIWAPLRVLFCERQARLSGNWGDKAWLWWPLLGFIGFLALCGLGFLLYLAYPHALDILRFLVFATFFIALAVGLTAGAGWVDKHRIGWADAIQVYRDYRAARASRLCPLVEMEEDPRHETPFRKT